MVTLISEFVYPLTFAPTLLTVLVSMVLAQLSDPLKMSI